MAVDTAAGSKFYIGPVNSTAADSTAYEALSYTLVGEVESIGEFGDQYNPVTFTALDDRRVRKFKGSADAGTISLTIGHDSADTGQTNLDTALASDSDYAFKVTLDDAGTGSPSSPTTYYFRGKVMSTRVNPGDAENIVRVSAEVAINSAIVKVDAV
jgi:hypothetical protein